jgi:glycosyltransferase involved in cell wall biosynthesis
VRLLLTHPYFWPHVRRGAEREIHDLGAGLVARGHRVRLLTGQPHGITTRDEIDGLEVRYVRTPVPGPLARRGVSTPAAFGAVAAAGAALSRADAVLSFLYADAYGASLAGRLPHRRGVPVVAKLTGTVLPERITHERVERALFRRALDAAGEVWCNSAYARDVMAGFGVPMRVVPAGFDPAVFRPAAERDATPTVFCASAPDEPRKRVVDLVRAWPAIRDGLPGARLLLAGHASAATREQLLAALPAQLRAEVSFAGLLDDAALAAAYGGATVVVAPSVHEALGLVVLEALACGTPVAGADSGATTELLAVPGTGALFAPLDPDACARAVLAAAALAVAPGTRERCVGAAAPWAWPAILDRVEQRLTALRADRA